MDDCSDGKDDKKRSAKKIAKEFSKLLKKEKIRLQKIQEKAGRIETEEDWERVAQAADIFTSIFAQIDEGEATVDSEEESAIAEMCRNHLANNIVQMELVSENLKERAREILSEHWGENFVLTAEKQMGRQTKC